MTRTHKRTVFCSVGYCGEKKMKHRSTKKPMEIIKTGAPVADVLDCYDEEGVTASHGRYRKIEGKRWADGRLEFYATIPRQRSSRGRIPFRESDKRRLQDILETTNPAIIAWWVKKHS